jgi:KDO2-lipid IV(A) lauroyltransferase
VAERARWSPRALLEWALVASLFKLLNWLPEPAAYALGEGAGRLAFRLDGRHRTIAMENLSRAFPGEYTPGEIERLARAVFENLGRTAVDMARSESLLRAPDAVRIDGLDRMQEASRRGKGVLFITAHFGPWELLPLIDGLRYRPTHTVVRPLDNPRLDDLFTALRERGGNRVIRKRDAVQAVLQALRRGETVGILIDQHIQEKDGVVVPYFGRPASTAFAPALIAMRSGAAVLSLAILREGRGRFRVVIGDEVPIRRGRDLKADLVENTARFTRAIEAVIRRRPDHWFWVHRRWKTQHPLDPRFTPHDPAREREGERVGASPAAFLDRDGTIIEDPGYLRDPEKIQFIPGSIDALRALQRAGYRLVLISNQAGVARGLLTEGDVRRVNERLIALLAEAGVRLDGVYYCPHHPDYGPPEYRRDCDCRKPRPGMVHRAARDLRLDPSRSVVIGDHITDATLAQVFPGMVGIMLRTGHGAEQWQKIQEGALAAPEHVADDLRSAVDWFLARVGEQHDVCPHPA